jgi:hypothetical protein
LRFAPGAKIILNTCDIGEGRSAIGNYGGNVIQSFTDAVGVTVYAPKQKVDRGTVLYPDAEARNLSKFFDAYRPIVPTTQP